MSRCIRSGKISASLLGTFEFCETAALLSAQGVDVTKEVHDRMSEGTCRHSSISATADMIRRRERANNVAAAIILFLVILLSYLVYR